MVRSNMFLDGDLHCLVAVQAFTALRTILRINGEPLRDVTLRIGDSATRTDDTGRFLLTGVAPGVYALLIAGRSASRPGRTYGI